jgi:NitT/TauT family transport system ATP-binding protein
MSSSQYAGGLVGQGLGAAQAGHGHQPPQPPSADRTRGRIGTAADQLNQVIPSATNPTGRPARVVVRDLQISYQDPRAKQDFVAVADATFEIAPEELVCLVGPSGCGKSSVLGAIAGLTPYRRGAIEVDGSPVRGPGRDRAVVFQRPSLLPWLTAVDNVAYGLRIAGIKKNQARQRASEALELVGLQDFARSYPPTLSGGMQQRVNLARALAANPRLLLLDEPFSALDAQQRESLQGELLRIWQSQQTTGLFITHQIDEAVLLADRVIVSGRGPAAEISTVIAIDLPRPRNRETRLDPRFAAYVEEIWQLIMSSQPHG